MQKEIQGQTTLAGSLRQVEVRLKLIDGPPIYGGTEIHSPEDAVQLMKNLMIDLDREYFSVMNLDSAGSPLHFNTVSIGDVATTIVPIQNVFKSAILSNASSIICFHCHPSGNVEPSLQDDVVTKRVCAVGNLMNIPVMDHIIIGSGTGEIYSYLKNKPDLMKTVCAIETLPVTYQRQQELADENYQLAMAAEPHVHKHR